MKSVYNNPMFRFLTITTIASGVGLQTWRTLFNNFSVEIVHLQGDQVGMIQSVREIPGFLALLAIFLFLVIREHKVSALSIAIMGVGIGFTGIFPSYPGLIFTTLVMSFGFHYYETTNQSLTLQYFEKSKSPWVFGKFRSYSAATNIIVGIILFGATLILDYKELYLIVGSLIFGIGIWGLFQNPTNNDLAPQHKKMILRKKYGLYYFLTFMAGARRQIFVTFAVFLLVWKFEYSVREITILFVLNNVINYFLSPIIGKSIIRFGEQRVLSTEYFSLIFIFLGYALTESKLIVAFLYILDHIFFNFSIAIRTYFQKIGSKNHIAPTMAVGFTINHIAAVVIPAMGGLAWIIDYRIPFIAGMILSVISFTATQFVNSSIKKLAETETSS